MNTKQSITRICEALADIIDSNDMDRRITDASLEAHIKDKYAAQNERDAALAKAQKLEAQVEVISDRNSNQARNIERLQEEIRQLKEGRDDYANHVGCAVRDSWESYAKYLRKHIVPSSRGGVKSFHQFDVSQVPERKTD